MDSLIYILYISIFFPLFLMMLLVEKRARLPIIFVLLLYVMFAPVKKETLGEDII